VEWTEIHAYCARRTSAYLDELVHLKPSDGPGSIPTARGTIASSRGGYSAARLPLMAVRAPSPVGGTAETVRGRKRPKPDAQETLRPVVQNFLTVGRNAAEADCPQTRSGLQRFPCIRYCKKF
jgi:hypothetical protein